MTIGDRVKEQRIKRNISQTTLAQRIHVSKQTLFKYENNIVTNIPSDKIEMLADALNVSPAHLMGWTEKQLSSPGISRESGGYVDHTTPNQLIDIYTYLKSQQKEPTLQVLTEVLNELPTEAYREINDFLMYTKFKYNIRRTEQ